MMDVQIALLGLAVLMIVVASWVFYSYFAPQGIDGR